MKIPIGVKLVPSVAALVTIGLLLSVSSASAAVEGKPFGIARFSMQVVGRTNISENPYSPSQRRFENVPEAFTQAEGHPWALATTIEFATEEVGGEYGGGQTHQLVPTRDPKDVVVDLPPGLLGNPLAVPRCPLVDAVSTNVQCPASTQIGEGVIIKQGPVAGEHQAIRGGIFNLTPEAGQSAEFGLQLYGITYLLTAHVVHTASGYGLTVVDNEIPGVALVGTELTFWGVPADPSHDPTRGIRQCESVIGSEGYATCNDNGGESAGVPPVPFLTMPGDCSAGPVSGTMRADSWEEPGRFVEAQSTLPAMTGCNLLQFNPTIGVEPDTLLADEPVGLGVSFKVPQVLKPEASETPQLRNLDVTLPEGLSISPGIVDGIQACNESGPEGINFTGPESEEIGLNGEPQLAPGHCPNASTVGTAEAITPLLGEPVKGHIYLARPGCGGAGQAACTAQDALDGNLYQLYLELGGVGPLANTGVNLKVPLKTEANPATGQLTTVAEDNPQLPFSELKVDLNGGPRAPLDTPAACGPATTTSDFTPWSAPGTTPEGLFMRGTPDATPSSFFDVGGCASPPGLNPGFQAGTVSPQAGQFSAFTLNLSRQDREQFIKGIQVHTPPGLLGMLASVPLCEEPAADAGSCPEASKIGTTRVASGAGSHPFEIEGNVYLTGGYGGAPFGLSIVTHAVAGPFNLGLVVVRARIAVDPENSTLTITTDETGPYAVPQILDGVPLRLKQVTVDIDRPGFMFNPTSCAAQKLTARISGAQDASASVASPFAAAGCESLAFKPQFTASTSGHTSRVDGASLDVKLSYPPGSLGSEANIASVKVELPKQLPAQLKTLQRACTAAQFATNPAGCPAASVVGIVKASTPVLPVGLEGPVYFVSHGGEAFPSLIVVLQGDGVRVDLAGSTFINGRTGITSSTFKTVPDVPVSAFELYLPEGPYPALAATANLCKAQAKLVMPTAFLAQNGAELHQKTKINVTGCAKAKKLTRKKAKAKRRARARKANETGYGRTR